MLTLAALAVLTLTAALAASVHHHRARRTRANPDTILEQAQADLTAATPPGPVTGEWRYNVRKIPAGQRHDHPRSPDTPTPT